MSQPFCPRISSLGMHDLCTKNGLHGNKGLQSLRSSEQDCGHGRNSQKHQACSTAICKRCSDFKQFVSMCARWCMPMCMCACVWRSEVNVGCPFLVLLSLRQSPTEPGACWLGETGWLTSCSPVHGLWAQAAVGFSRAWTMATSCSWIFYTDAGNWPQVLKSKQQICHRSNHLLNPPFMSWVSQFVLFIHYRKNSIYSLFSVFWSTQSCI